MLTESIQRVFLSVTFRAVIDYISWSFSLLLVYYARRKPNPILTIFNSHIRLNYDCDRCPRRGGILLIILVTPQIINKPTIRKPK